MSEQYLQDATVEGIFEESLESADIGWVESIALRRKGDITTQLMLGATPGYKEYIGSRREERIREKALRLVTRHYDSSFGFELDDVLLTQLDFVTQKAAEWGEGLASHWAEMVTELIADAETDLAWDGKAFFAHDHAWGLSGALDNLLHCDISGYPGLLSHGTPTAPSVEEACVVIMKIIQALQSFKNDQGRPINQTMKRIQIQAPVTLAGTFQTAVASQQFGAGAPNPLVKQPIQIDVVQNPLLTWTADVVGFRADGLHQPIVIADRLGPRNAYLGPDSEYAVLNHKVIYVSDVYRGAILGDCRTAVKAKME